MPLEYFLKSFLKRFDEFVQFIVNSSIYKPLREIGKWPPNIKFHIIREVASNIGLDPVNLRLFGLDKMYFGVDLSGGHIRL